MIYDHPRSGIPLDSLEDYPSASHLRGNSYLWPILALLVAGCVAFATLAPSIDYDRLAAYLPWNEPANETITEEEKKELIAVAKGEDNAIAAEGLEAEQINAAMPMSKLPVEAAKPFLIASSIPAGATAQQCLAQAIYYEAGFESELGKYAVAQVIINRARHPAFAKSICGVVYQGSTRPGCQFSFTCDGSLLRKPEAGAWAEARRIASAVLSGTVTLAVGLATHYHADYVSPYWAPKLVKINKIGAHIFYRWPGNWGRPAAFNGVYTGREFIPAYSTLANINAGSMTTEEVAVETNVAVPRDVTDRRANNDIGGRIDTTKTWRLSIPVPAETRGAFQALADQQKTAGMGQTGVSE